MTAFSEELTFPKALNMRKISFLMQRQRYLTCTWAVFCGCYINTVKSVLTTWHKPTNNKQMQSSVLELQRCTEAVVISHGHIMLWGRPDIFHVCRETCQQQTAIVVRGMTWVSALMYLGKSGCWSHTQATSCRLGSWNKSCGDKNSKCQLSLVKWLYVFVCSEDERAGQSQHSLWTSFQYGRGK